MGGDPNPKVGARPGPGSLPEVKPDSAAPAASPRQESPQEAKNTFRHENPVERFMRAFERRLERQMEGLYNKIRLPGSDRVIRDHRHERRERHERGAERHADTSVKKEAQVRGHGTIEVSARREARGRVGENALLAELERKLPAYLSGVKVEHHSAPVPSGKEKPLTPFEQQLIACFEEGAPLPEELPEGQFHFLKKTAGEWSGFFEKFLSRTIEKAVSWEEVKGLLFRGLLKEKGNPDGGVMISDILMNGGADKFARIPLPLAKALGMVATTPGTVLPAEVLQTAVNSEQLQYLAISAQQAEAAQFTQAASRGLFSSQEIENRVSEQLGIRMPAELLRKEEPIFNPAQHSRRRRMRWTAWFWGEDVPEDHATRFVPWWSWERDERTGPRKWFVGVFSAVIFFILAMAVVALIRYLRG